MITSETSDLMGQDVSKFRGGDNLSELIFRLGVYYIVKHQLVLCIVWISYLIYALYMCKYSCQNQKSKALLCSQGFGEFPYLVFHILPSLLMPLFTNSVHYSYLMVSGQ